MGNLESTTRQKQKFNKNKRQQPSKKRPLVQKNKDDIQTILDKIQLNQEEINNLVLQSSNYTHHLSCSNKVEGQILFICLDCTKNKQYGQCEQCFTQSVHLNHRYYNIKSTFETFCACGTNRNGQSSYSCKNHTLKNVINDSFEAHQLYLYQLDHILLSKIDSYFQNQITNIQVNFQKKYNFNLYILNSSQIVVKKLREFINHYSNKNYIFYFFRINYNFNMKIKEINFNISLNNQINLNILQIFQFQQIFEILYLIIPQLKQTIILNSQFKYQYIQFEDFITYQIIQFLEKVMNEIYIFCCYGFLAQVIIAEMLCKKIKNISFLEKMGILLYQFSIKYQDLTQSITNIISQMNSLFSSITFHKSFEEEKAKFSIITYDIKVLNGKDSIKYGLYNFYTRESIIICLTTYDFIQKRRKEIIASREQFIQNSDNSNEQETIEQLNRFQECMFHLNPKNNFNFENIDELWSGLSLIFEAFFYSRDVQFRNQNELILHMHYDQNSLSFFFYFLNHIQFINDENRRNQFQLEIFKFIVIQCKKRGEIEHNFHSILASEISQEEIWPIFTLPYRFLTIYLCYLYYQCDGNISELKKLVDSYSQNISLNLFEQVLYRMSKEFSACYLFFKNRHVEPDSVSEFFEMVMRKEKSYSRVCYDLSIEYRKPTFCLHDTDISGLQLAIILCRDKKQVLQYIGQGMAIQNILDYNQRKQQLNTIDQLHQKNLLLREIAYFELILVINSNELSFSNVLFNLFGKKAKKFYKIPFQLAIINQFNQQTVYKIPQLKEKLDLEIHRECDSYKELMQDICIYNSVDQNFQLQPQYKNFHDVFMFYKNTKRQGEFYSVIRERAEKEISFDCIAGNIIDLQDKMYYSNNINNTINQCISIDIIEIENFSQMLSQRIKELDIKDPIHLSFMKYYCYLCYILLKRSQDYNLNTLVKDKELINFIQSCENDAEIKNCIKKLLQLINDKRNSMNMSTLHPPQNELSTVQFQNQLKKTDRAKEAQKRVMEEFSNKQKGFLNMNQEVYDNEAEKQQNGEKKIFCQICQQQNEELTVIQCYLDLDNLCSLYDDALNLNKVNFHEEFLSNDKTPQSNNSICLTSLANNQNYEKRCTLSSCMHSFHEKCFQAQMNTNPNKIPQRVLSPNHEKISKEMFCSQCKTLSNISLIYLDHIYKKIPFKSKNNFQIFPTENDSIIQIDFDTFNLFSSNISQEYSKISETPTPRPPQLNEQTSCGSLKKEYNEQEYFDYLTINIVEMEQHIKYQKKNITDFIDYYQQHGSNFIENLSSTVKSFAEKFHDLSILISDEDIQTILSQNYQYQLDIAFSNGISDFLSKNIIISKAILQNLSLLQCVHKADFSIYTKAQERILLHLNKFHNFKFVLIQKLHKQNFSFDDIWRQVASDIYLIYNNDQNKLKQLLKAFGLLYLQYIQIFYAFLLAKQREIPQFSIEKLKDMYLGDIEFRLSCQIFSLPYLRLVMLTLITMFEFNEEIINNHLRQKYIDEEKEIEVYESILGKDFIHINFNSIMQSSNTQNFWNLYIQDLNNLDNTQKLQPFLEKNPCFKFSFVNIGDNFQQFHRFHYKPCTLCNRYSPKTKLVLCLICGQVMCVVDCNLQQNKIPVNKTLKNNFNYILLNYTQINQNFMLIGIGYHEGKTIFMSLQNHEVLLIDYPKGIAMITHIFQDEIGQPFELANNENWEKYVINKKKIDNLKQILFNRKLPQHIRSVLWYEDPNIKCIEQQY